MLPEIRALADRFKLTAGVLGETVKRYIAGGRADVFKNDADGHRRLGPRRASGVRASAGQ